LKLKRLSENDANGLKSGARAFGVPRVEAVCAEAVLAVASPSAIPATKAMHLFMEFYLMELSKPMRCRSHQVSCLQPLSDYPTLPSPTAKSPIHSAFGA
jgi:hypothetical protein